MIEHLVFYHSIPFLYAQIEHSSNHVCVSFHYLLWIVTYHALSFISVFQILLSLNSESVSLRQNIGKSFMYTYNKIGDNGSPVLNLVLYEPPILSRSHWSKNQVYVEMLVTFYQPHHVLFFGSVSATVSG